MKGGAVLAVHMCDILWDVTLGATVRQMDFFLHFVGIPHSHPSPCLFTKQEQVILVFGDDNKGRSRHVCFCCSAQSMSKSRRRLDLSQWAVVCHAKQMVIPHVTGNGKIASSRTTDVLEPLLFSCCASHSFGWLRATHFHVSPVLPSMGKRGVISSPGAPFCSREEELNYSIASALHCPTVFLFCPT